MATVYPTQERRTETFSWSQNVLLDRAVPGLPWENLSWATKEKKALSVWRGRGEGGERSGNEHSRQGNSTCKGLEVRGMWQVPCQCGWCAKWGWVMLEFGCYFLFAIRNCWRVLNQRGKGRKTECVCVRLTLKRTHRFWKDNSNGTSQSPFYSSCMPTMQCVFQAGVLSCPFETEKQVQELCSAAMELGLQILSLELVYSPHFKLFTNYWKNANSLKNS